MVLVLSTLHQLLAQLLALPELHTAILLTPEGQLISVASDISRSKDQARIVAGVSGEVWQETREQGHGMVESELGRIVVLPVVKDQDPEADALDPLLLLALNSTNSVEWENLLAKGKTLVDHIAPSMDKFRRDHSQAARSPTVVISSDRPSR
ncbi:hypothetical protein PILCRDRAFT_813694 [Piloderma croceum F 1598]|uniref:Roadblock/LAMTOR2 domain-containing protein n=1 Tax=Piloderma croceum (strain F 1598) TaxID=765440 RepID=A0A0C3BQE7_PILCF|nr:hypothetical protein PILCRDRAFT_813694 [Piloderma croceum F 1598]